MSRLRLLCTLLLVAGLVMLGLPAQAQGDDDAQGGDPSLTDDPACFGLEGTDSLAQVQSMREVTCHTLAVPLFHDEPEAGTAELAVAVLHAVEEPTGPPIVKLTGGPGEAAIGLGLLLFGLNAEITLGPEGLSRDVVLIDQRGTGYSSPNLDCPEVGAIAPAAGIPGAMSRWTEAPAEFTQLPGGEAFFDAIQACYDRLAAETDLSAFTTRANATDLDLLRQALGEDQLALYGTSYGAKLALRAAAMFPDSWSALVLSSPVPGDANFMAEIATNYDEVLAAVDRTCAEDPRCTFEDLVDRASARIVELAESPAEVSVPGPGGQTLTTVLEPNVVASSLYQLHYLDAAPVAPLLDGLADGKDRGFTFSLGTSADGFSLNQASSVPQLPEDGPLPAAFGMQLSNICAEELAFTDPDAYEESLADASPLAAAFGAAPFFGAISPQVCEIWDVDQASPETFDAVESDIPTLVVTGTFDQITPVSYGERTVEGLSAGQLVEVPDGVHAPLLGLAACGGNMLSAFLADPSATVDASCATERDNALDAILPDAPTLGAERLAGGDRFATAAASSRYTFPAGAEVVIVASGDAAADALVGGAAGGAIAAPLLLTGGTTLPESTADELARLQPEQVVVLGGTAAVDEATAEAIGAAADAPVERIAGEDRFDTAAQVAAAFFAEADGAWLATGGDFADALTAGAAAANRAQPVLLTGDELPPATSAALEALQPAELTVVGGENAVSSAVMEAAAASAGVAEPVRLAGPDRYATSAAVAATFPPTPTSRLAGIAVSGDGFADALAATPLAAGRAPLLLLSADSAPEPVRQAMAGRIGSIAAVGGPAVLSDSAVISLVAAVGAAPPEADPPPADQPPPTGTLGW